jgi:ABC-2 type transport system permease protein
VSVHAPVNGWRTARITALSEILSPARLAGNAIRMTVQVFLVLCLWRALYAYTDVTAGLTRSMALTYAVLAVLMLQIRRADRFAARDHVFQHMHYGTIVYWYLRPLSPQRYSLWRGVGEQAYGFGWAAAGYVACLATAVIGPPSSAGAAMAFLVTFAVGQSLLYYLGLLTDQMCFFAIKNASVVLIVKFTQNLLSGAYAALWFFPAWFRSVSAFLPFQYTIGVPLSLYIGRIPAADVWVQLAAALGWVVALAMLTRLLWRKAAVRISAQGG